MWYTFPIRTMGTYSLTQFETFFFDRPFHVRSFQGEQKQLVLYSPKSKVNNFALSITFSGVRFMHITSTYSSITLRLATVEEIASLQNSLTIEDSADIKVFVLNKNIEEGYILSNAITLEQGE